MQPRPAPNQPGKLGQWPSAWQMGRPPPHEGGHGGQLLITGLLRDLACKGIQDAQDLRGAPWAAPYKRIPGWRHQKMAIDYCGKTQQGPDRWH